MPFSFCLSALPHLGGKDANMVVKYRDQDGMNIKVNLPDDTQRDLLEEVLNFLESDSKNYHALLERERYHRMASIDAMPFENQDIANHMTPESILIRKETSKEVEGWLDTLTETQRRRMLLLMDGMSLRQIAQIEHVDFSSVAESLNSARKKIKKI